MPVVPVYMYGNGNTGTETSIQQERKCVQCLVCEGCSCNSLKSLGVVKKIVTKDVVFFVIVYMCRK